MSSLAEVSAKPLRSNAPRHDFTNDASAAGLLLLCFVLGALAMLPVTVDLFRLWRDDPLRSFGALLPLVSIGLIVRAWKREQWTGRGTPYGLVPLLLAVALARTVGTILLAYRYHGDDEFSLVQPGLLWFLFGSGLVLLLGGTRLWRAALFPLCLLLCVNPVPHLFERLDFPLQTVSANTARGFAHLLGLRPSGEQLQMMFAPRFGMVIVPGCDGVRGSATMVYLAVLIGYLRRMRPGRTALLALAGLVTGYLLNLVRLCTLVVYYWVGTHFPNLRGNGEVVDYCIGGTLFVLVCFAAGYLLFRPAATHTTAQAGPRRSLPPRIAWGPRLTSASTLSAFAGLLIAAATQTPAAWARRTQTADYVPPETAAAALPTTAGAWHSGKQSQEIYYGHPVWHWTTYTRPDGATVDLGIWLSARRHYAIQSRLMNGSKPLLGDRMHATDRDAHPADFSTFTLNDDLVENSLPVPTFFAETVCLPARCSMQESGFGAKGWIVAVTPTDLRSSRHLPLLFRVQSTPGTTETPATQAQARQWIDDLVAQLDLNALTEKLGSR